MTNFIVGEGRHFRAATDADFIWQLSYLTDYDDHDATSEQITVQDALIERVTSEYSDPIYNLALSGDTTGVTVDVLDATGSLDGLQLARVSNGNCRVKIGNRLKTTITTFNMSRINGAVHDSLDSYVSGSLARHLVDGMTSLIGDKTSASKPIYTTQNHGTATYIRNTDCWAYPINLTAISPWNSRGANTRAGTAITPRHTIQAAHYPLAISDTIRFVTSDNTVVTRTASAVQSIPGTDIQIALLDSDLPASITPLKFLPANITDYLPSLTSYPVPVLATDQQEHALVKETDPVLWTIPSAAYFRNATSDPFDRMTETIIVGDSGNPICAVINGVAAITSHWNWSSGGPRYSALLTEIAAALTTLGGGHTLSTVDLSSFTNYGA